MAGETIKSEAICLSINAWSKTSHIVNWLTPRGKIATVSRGAERPKSHLLGQYDLNYTCEIVYYAHERGEVHALRECWPLASRDNLRENYRALTLAGYCRHLVAEFAPIGEECSEWYEMLRGELDHLTGGLGAEPFEGVAEMVKFELRVLSLLGLEPRLEGDSGSLLLRGERRMPVSKEVAEFLRNPKKKVENPLTPLDAGRVIGVFYQFHLGCSAEIRRATLEVICKKQGKMQ